MMKHTLTHAFISVIAGTVGLVLSIPSFAQPTPLQPPPGKFQLLPASPEPPEILAERQQAEQALQSINQGRLTPQQKRQMLLNHPNPNIRTKAQLAANRAPGKPVPASSEPPELTAQQQEDEHALNSINQGRLTPQQKRLLLLNHPKPSIRAKAQEAQRLRLQPRGDLNQSGSFAGLSSLWALFNPFTPTEAQAQSGFAVTLTPQQHSSSSPYAYFNLYGAIATGGSQGFTSYKLDNTSHPVLGYTFTKPTVAVVVNIPSAGWYLLDFYGYGKPSATLRESQTVQLETWNMSASPTILNHFATAEYLAAGFHYFQFIVDTSYLYLYEVSVEAF